VKKEGCGELMKGKLLLKLLVCKKRTSKQSKVACPEGLSMKKNLASGACA
jgi:hypothetical protein